jgi:hypothetical protein
VPLIPGNIGSKRNTDGRGKREREAAKPTRRVIILAELILIKQQGRDYASIPRRIRSRIPWCLLSCVPLARNINSPDFLKFLVALNAVTIPGICARTRARVFCDTSGVRERGILMGYPYLVVQLGKSFFCLPSFQKYRRFESVELELKSQS